MRNFIEKIVVICLLMTTSCTSGFLDVKPASNILQPTSLEDFQGLLDNFSVMNNRLPALPLLSCDDFHFNSEQAWMAARSETVRSCYTWEHDVFGGEINKDDWNGSYEAIFYSNIVINGIEDVEISLDDRHVANQIKGSAYFLRAYRFYALLNSFGELWSENTEETALGIPIKLSSDVNEVVERATVKETYDQIFSDLARARGLLSFTEPDQRRNRPTLLALFALNARIHLFRSDFQQALAYADTALAHYNTLTDYNTLDTNSTAPFTIREPENILSMGLANRSYGEFDALNGGGRISIDSNLIRSYGVNDLRKQVFFRINNNGIGYQVKRNYYGSANYAYNGLATNELYLIKAECLARLGQPKEALSVVDALLSKRYLHGTYEPVLAQDSNINDALRIILEERRKELVWRGLRWDDLKRMNREGANISLERILGGKHYHLPANDKRYVFNIPADEIVLSKIKQNER